MTDPTQFMVEQAHLHKILEHQGILGTGRDFLTQKVCSLHLYVDSNKRTYVMQHFDQVDQQFVSNKLTNLTKTSHSNFMSNITRVCFVSTRKTQKNLFQLNVYYDATGVYGYSLEYIIKMKIKNSEKFDDEEILGFFWQIADFILLCGKDTGEFMEITPVNIFCKPDQFQGFNFFPNNFGLCFDGMKWERNYSNKADKFWQGDKNLQNCVKSTLFILGMVMLEMCTLESPNSLYLNNQLDHKLVQKKIQAIKITRMPLLCNIIKNLLLPEEERISIKAIYENKQYLKYRKVQYFRNKAGVFGFKTFEGIAEFSKINAIGQGLDDNLHLNRGKFVHGKLDGLGMQESQVDQKNLLNMGIFKENIFLEGMQIHKNEAIYIGKTSSEDGNKLIKKGIMIVLNISTLGQDSKQNNFVAFEGQFDNLGNPLKGTKHYQNGQKQNI